MKFGSTDLNSFESNVCNTANIIDIIETNSMHLFSNILIVVVLDVQLYQHKLTTNL